MHEKRGVATLKEGTVSVFLTREEIREKPCNVCRSQKFPYSQWHLAIILANKSEQKFHTQPYILYANVSLNSETYKIVAQTSQKKKLHFSYILFYLTLFIFIFLFFVRRNNWQEHVLYWCEIWSSVRLK